MTIGKKICAFTGLLIVSLGMAPPFQAEILGDYVGYAACNACHPNVVEGWKTTAHAKAFETLKAQGEEKQENPGCLECHVVGFSKEGGFIDGELTPELKNVQCESCHGPGRRHVETIKSTDILGKPGETTCRTCHTEGQDQAFDFKAKSQAMHGK